MDIEGESSYSHHDDSMKMKNRFNMKIMKMHNILKQKLTNFQDVHQLNCQNLLKLVKFGNTTKNVNFKQNKKATCNHCNTTYTCSEGSTSNLKKHLTRRHPNKPQESNQLTITDVFNINTKVNISIYIKFFYLSYIIINY